MSFEDNITPVSKSSGVLWVEGVSSNEALAQRDYSKDCLYPQEPIVIFKGYHIWWCNTHHQPMFMCDIARIKGIRLE